MLPERSELFFYEESWGEVGPSSFSKTIALGISEEVLEALSQIRSGLKLYNYACWA